MEKQNQDAHLGPPTSNSRAQSVAPDDRRGLLNHSQNSDSHNHAAELRAWRSALAVVSLHCRRTWKTLKKLSPRHRGDRVQPIPTTTGPPSPPSPTHPSNLPAHPHVTTTLQPYTPHATPLNLPPSNCVNDTLEHSHIATERATQSMQTQQELRQKQFKAFPVTKPPKKPHNGMVSIKTYMGNNETVEVDVLVDSAHVVHQYEADKESGVVVTSDGESIIPALAKDIVTPSSEHDNHHDKNLLNKALGSIARPFLDNTLKPRVGSFIAPMIPFKTPKALLLADGTTQLKVIGVVKIEILLCNNQYQFHDNSITLPAYRWEADLLVVDSDAVDQRFGFDIVFGNKAIGEKRMFEGGELMASGKLKGNYESANPQAVAGALRTQQATAQSYNYLLPHGSNYPAANSSNGSSSATHNGNAGHSQGSNHPAANSSSGSSSATHTGNAGHSQNSDR